MSIVPKQVSLPIFKETKQYRRIHGRDIHLLYVSAVTIYVSDKHVRSGADLPQFSTADASRG
jgi:hypothetical protein